MDVNRAIDNLIDNMGPLEPNLSLSEVLYHKLEEDLDCLPQVEGGFGPSTTGQRRIWIIYNKSEEDKTPSIEGLPSPLTTRTEEDLDHL
jgi:hypothetical protein